MLISEQFISILDGQIYIKRWKPAQANDKSPLILFHDSLGCVQTWRDFPELLATKLNREIIAYDRLGFGRSSAREKLPSIHFINEEAELYFPQLIKALGISKYLLFGHSVGGAMALVCANNFVDNCEFVITESAQAFVEEQTRQGILKASQEFMNPSLFSKLIKYHGDKAEWVLNAWNQVWLSAEFSSWELKKDLNKIKCPTLIIHGDRDEYGSEAFPDLIKASVTKSEKYIIEDCGHVPHRERPQKILELINQFIERH